MKKHLLPFLITFTVHFGISNYSSAQNIYHVAGGGISGYGGDGGPAANGQFNQMINLAIDAAGNIYICDSWNHRIRKINTSGIISTIAGTGVSGFSGDGALAINAMLNNPLWVSVDANGNIYISDSGNNRIRKINNAGIISTIAGNGTSGDSGDGGPALNASFRVPVGMTFDPAGNLYFSDQNNHKVRKIDPSGIITSFAGNGFGGYSGDGGQAINAKLHYPSGVKIDASGNVFVTELTNKVIRKINTSGIITTVVGTGTPGYSGDGGLATNAQIGGTSDVSFDSQGNMLFCDQWNHRIRQVNTAGIITTIAGTGVALSSGNGGPAISAEIYQPRDLEIDPNGNIYLIDNGSNSVRVICTTNCLAGIDKLAEGNKNQISIYPNPNNGSFNIEVEDESAKLKLINTIGQIVHSQVLVLGKNEIKTNELNKGFYSCEITSESNRTQYWKIIIE